MRVFISAGEASGDAYGAALVRELRRLHDPASSATVAAQIWALAEETLEPIAHFEPEGEFAKTWDVSDLEDVEFVEALDKIFDIVLPAGISARWKTNQDVVETVMEALHHKRGRQVDPLTAEGIGGRAMDAAGVRLHADSSKWGAISIVQSLSVVPSAIEGYHDAKRQLSVGTPGLFIPIDFGYANIRLARHAKRHGWRVLYFVPPGSWRRDRQGKDLPPLTDAIVTPFEWSATLLTEMGAKAYWFGHPIKQLLGEKLAPAPAEERTTVAVLPGSRTHELSENLPVIAQAVADLPAVLEFALAPTVDVEAFKTRWSHLAPARKHDKFTRNDTPGVVGRARAGIVCSGTATLEAALTGCPMVVIYRVSRAMEIEAKVIGFKRPKYIALPNILLDRTVVPELVQDEATPQAIRSSLNDLIGETDVRQAQLDAFAELNSLLGEAQAITKTAELALSIMR